MKTFRKEKSGAGTRERFRACGLILLAITMTGVAAPRQARAQSAESGDEGAARLSVGGGGSGFVLGYGSRKMLAGTTWVDGDTIRRLGVEGEGRWLEFHQTANVHAETYLGGLRYHLNYGRTQPYVKALAGFGNFNFPYGYATGRYFIAAGGGGLDYRINRRWMARADFEYQNWPQFTYGSMNAFGATIGLRFRIF